MKSNRNLGVILIFIGVVILLINLGILGITWENFWPLILLGVGLLLELSYFAGGRRDPGLLVPGGIILTISLIFLVCVYLGWHWMERLWPLFILGPAVGLFQLYIFGKREPGLLIPVGILSVIGLTFLSITFGIFKSFRIVVPVVLIIIGVGILFRKE